MSKLLCAALAVTVFAPWSPWAIAQPSGAPQGQGGNNPAFARAIAGTYVEATPPYSTLYNFRADGTMDWFGSWFFGDGTETFLDGPVYGSWQQTGPHEITTLEVGHLFDGAGTFDATGRVRQVFTFAPDLGSITNYSYAEDLFDPNQDPTDPTAVPFFSFSGSGGTIRRLRPAN